MNAPHAAAPHRPRVGLLLTGGGARAAYQVGVLQAIAEWLPPGAPTPFAVISGSSAGAINAALLASHAGAFATGVDALSRLWGRLACSDVFRTDWRAALVSGLLWTGSLAAGGLGRLTPRSLLDSRPLRALLGRHIDFAAVRTAIEDGTLHAFSLSAAGYNSGQSITFFMGHAGLRPWQRTRRIGMPRPLTLDHLMASCAIPFVFPAVRIGYDWYGDGSMRQIAPLSAPLHLGADRLLVIGVREETPDEPDRPILRLEYPSPGQIAGYILDTLFMDALSADIERARRINRTLALIPPERRAQLALRPIEIATVFPSRDVRLIAAHHEAHFPRSVRYLLHSLGATRGRGRPLISYLLFEGGFCGELIALGYRDAQDARERLCTLLGLAHPATTLRP
ncbi:MAG TPA: patatin-like phospholipase family protein [Plasticicumulans sp.]|uniref:patatin-like phospholipase family protein n=1 Tax=Plasticicumulans sp. TaxID=2307179 RepID=UPI002BD05510|nr:patatin-like phospholipase family protein [Plasticicumulans sp.]HNG50210.1 patatin-like phospholipase family protein [Plasticicumulans sp.]